MSLTASARPCLRCLATRSRPALPVLHHARTSTSTTSMSRFRPLSSFSRRRSISPDAAAASSARSLPPLTATQRAFLSRAIRVNQAGELAATLIYEAQTPLVVNSEPELRGLMAHMHAQEVGHLRTFNALAAKHRVRPTAMYPVWHAAATALGWATAMMGREAAMACTEAVETEIGDHYNRQVKFLIDTLEDMKKRGEPVSEELESLLATTRRIRDEELEHLDHAVEHDAKEAVPHELLTGVIRAGCRGAIWVSERL